MSASPKSRNPASSDATTYNNTKTIMDGQTPLINHSETSVIKPAILRSLCDLPAGKTGIVHGFNGGREYTARMAALGFTTGAEITIIQNYKRGPMIVSVRGCKVALGRGEAVKIQVEAM